MSELKQVITMFHSDSVSGTTIFNDGMKMYWTEGYSDVVLIDAVGAERRIPDNAQGVTHISTARGKDRDRKSDR